MSLYEFLLALGFWQWLGVLALAFIAAIAVEDVLAGIAGLFSRRQK